MNERYLRYLVSWMRSNKAKNRGVVYDGKNLHDLNRKVNSMKPVLRYRCHIFICHVDKPSICETHYVPLWPPRSHTAKLLDKVRIFQLQLRILVWTQQYITYIFKQYRIDYWTMFECYELKDFFTTPWRVLLLHWKCALSCPFPQLLMFGKDARTIPYHPNTTVPNFQGTNDQIRRRSFFKSFCRWWILHRLLVLEQINYAILEGMIAFGAWEVYKLSLHHNLSHFVHHSYSLYCNKFYFVHTFVYGAQRETRRNISSLLPE